MSERRYEEALRNQVNRWTDDEYATAMGPALAAALLNACLYLDGFVWLDEPEFSEMESMKRQVASALGVKTWEQAMEWARTHDGGDS